MKAKFINLRDVIGGGYDEFWNSEKRYVVCKGSKASKKSTTAAFKIIIKMVQYPLANTLVIRQTLSSLKDSCYAQLKWAINKLGITKFWKCTTNPLQMVYLPTKQKILFRGMDSADKIASITVEHGNLCFAWMEEAYECNQKDWEKVDLSLRGKLPEGYYIQWLITFNPWSAHSWLKSRFFDNPDENTLAMTTNYKCNEFLSESDILLYDSVEKTNPDLYKVIGLGDWGLGEGQYFKEWRTNLHVVKPFEIPKEWIKFRAMDFGIAKPSAVLWFAVDYDGNIFVYRELYTWNGRPNEGSGETAAQVAKKIISMEKRDENISYGVLDSACWARNGVTGETIAEAINNELCNAGLVTFGKSSKGRVEGANAIKQRLVGNMLADGTQKPALYFFQNCVHSIRTIPMLGFDKHNPETYDTNGDDHICDALAYGLLSRPFTPTRPEKEKTRDRYRHKEEFSVWNY